MVLGKDLEPPFHSGHEHDAVLPDGVKHPASHQRRSVIPGTGLRKSFTPQGLATYRIQALDFAAIPQQVNPPFVFGRRGDVRAGVFALSEPMCSSHVPGAAESNAVKAGSANIGSTTGD